MTTEGGRTNGRQND